MYVCVCPHNSREFRVVLREDPNSIFSPNVEIENTIGPVDYDVSRVYSGTLEGNLFVMTKQSALIAIAKEMKLNRNLIV